MTILDIGGALVGGFLGRTLGWYGEGDSVGFFMAVIGAMLMLSAYRKISGPSRVWGEGTHMESSPDTDSTRSRERAMSCLKTEQF